MPFELQFKGSNMRGTPSAQSPKIKRKRKQLQAARTATHSDKNADLFVQSTANDLEQKAVACV